MNRVLDNPPPQLDYAWEQLPELAQVVVRGIATAISSPDHSVDLQNAINALPSDYQEGLQRHRDRSHNALGTLIHHDWVERADQRYRLKVDLYRLWIEREHPPTQLAAFNWATLGAGQHAEQPIS